MNRLSALLVLLPGLLLPAILAAQDHSQGHGAPGQADAMHAGAAHDEAGMNDHMNDDPFIATLVIDQLEQQFHSGQDDLAWDVRVLAGHDFNRLLLRAEGARAPNETLANEGELLWWHAVAAYWNLVAGVRQDFGPGPGRTFAALGVEGLAPGEIHVELTGYKGEGGQSGARLKLEGEVLVTRSLVLVPRVEANAWGRNDEATGTGRGLADVQAGLRLRWALRRDFAPYLGVEWDRSFGPTADYARAAGEEADETFVVAGIHAWF